VRRSVFCQGRGKKRGADGERKIRPSEKEHGETNELSQSHEGGKELRVKTVEKGFAVNIGKRGGGPSEEKEKMELPPTTTVPAEGSLYHDQGIGATRRVGGRCGTDRRNKGQPKMGERGNVILFSRHS